MREVTFLVVDDSAMARKLVASVIRTKLGSDRIIHAGDGKQAIQILENDEIDVIISDWNMVDLDGDELLYHVRNHPRYKDTPFIMITTNNRRDFIMTALQLGVSQYVIKPFTPQELEKKIRSCWNSANKRTSERHAALPEHELRVQAGKKALEGKLLNLSGTGAFMRVPYSDLIRVYTEYQLEFRFENPDADQTWEIKGLKCSGVRIEADGDDRDSCLLAVQFDTGTLPPEAVREFTGLISWLGSRNPKFISN